jgi:3-phosphoshikimate 1-carboxyvinyltransferase
MTQAIELVCETRPVVARYAMPGSKSYTNRALLIAALANGESIVSNASPSADSDLFLKALRQLGYRVECTDTGSGTLQIAVTGTGRIRPTSNATIIDVGPAGTTMRFLTAFLAATSGGSNPQGVQLCGSARMHTRPIAPLVTALTGMGAKITCIGTPGYPPLHVYNSEPLKGGEVVIDGSVSSQFISALLMVAPMCNDSLKLCLTGPRISRSYIEMTTQSMKEFGVHVSQPAEDTFYVQRPAAYIPRTYGVEGDLSGASYLWAIAALSGGEISVSNVHSNSAQGDRLFPRILERMGCIVTETPNSITVRGTDTLRGIEVDMSDLPDTAQTLAVVAGCAEGSTLITGLATLRIKETDRLAALQNELAKVSIRSEVGDDWIRVFGGTPTTATIATYDDHRMAMSFAPLATRVPGLQICNPLVVEKSFPTFWDVLDSFGIRSCSKVGP